MVALSLSEFRFTYFDIHVGQIGERLLTTKLVDRVTFTKRPATATDQTLCPTDTIHLDQKAHLKRHFLDRIQSEYGNDVPGLRGCIKEEKSAIAQALTARAG
jgi:hypothetical protein